jgi:RNA ligase (TIGR02306 family)
MRKLATLARIEKILVHPNADTLELATVRGWQVVVKKGSFSQGDVCVYVEIDAVLPPKPEFEFMAPRHYRVKTIRLRGELSQGICFSTSILPDNKEPAEVGDDVTELIEIQLYQPPIPACLGGDVVGAFPSFIPKTDQERIQNHRWILDELRNEEWVVTEKIDGSSCTMFMRDGEFGVCSRNMQLKPSDNNAFWIAARKYQVEERFRGMNVAIQGELIGPKIQGNRYGLSDYQWRVFDVFHCERGDRGEYLDPYDAISFCKVMGLEMVPHLFRSHTFQTMDQMLLSAEDKSVLNPKVEREGLVWKPMQNRTDPRIGRVSFKVISNNFLLKSD